MAVIGFRAAAGVEVGTGHVMRCLALAEALADLGHDCRFLLSADLPDPLGRRVAGAGFPIATAALTTGSAQDAQWTGQWRAHSGAAALVVDGYGFGPGFRAALRTPGMVILTFDDLADGGLLHADLVVNPSPAVTTATYQLVATGARLLLGPAFAPIRREIQTLLLTDREPLRDRRRLLLTLGGSDPAGLTAPVMTALAPRLAPGCRLLVAVGGSNPNARSIVAAASRLGPSVEAVVDSPRFVTLMAGAGLAITAGGGTVGELAALGIPMVIAVTAANQAPAAARAALDRSAVVVEARAADAAAGVATAALALWADLDAREALAAQSMRRVDGQGARRIAQALADTVTHR